MTLEIMLVKSDAIASCTSGVGRNSCISISSMLFCGSLLSMPLATTLSLTAYAWKQCNDLFVWDLFVSPIWDMLCTRLTTIGVHEELKERLSLIDRLTMSSSKKGPLMAVLWGIYSMMNTLEVKEPTTTMLKEVMNETFRVREKSGRLTMPAFAVDVTTIRGRKGIDTTSELSEIKDASLYHPITASHGPNPHETTQTSKDSDNLIQKCKAIQTTDAIPEVFETFVWSETESDNLSFEKIERKVKRLRKNPEMVTAIQQANESRSTRH